MKKSKRYVESAKLVDSNKEYEIKEALEVIEKMPKTKFDETVELHVRLGVDSKHADQQVRGTVVLPNGTGKTQRVLVFAKGPKGLMPNPKSGTVTMDVTKAINEIKSGKVEYRLDKTNIIHLGFGKVSFGADKLAENYEVLMNAIIKAKPAAAKGQYIKGVSISTTMGPGLHINQK